MQNRKLSFSFFFFFLDLGLGIFFFSIPQWTVANCTHVHCVTEGGFLITHSQLLLKKLCPCALELISYRPDPDPAERAQIFLWRKRIWFQMKSQLHLKSRGMCGLSHKLILFQSLFAWTCSQALLSACLICLKNIHLQELASIFEYWLFFWVIKT